MRQSKRSVRDSLGFADRRANDTNPKLRFLMGVLRRLSPSDRALFPSFLTLFYPLYTTPFLESSQKRKVVKDRKRVL